MKRDRQPVISPHGFRVLGAGLILALAGTAAAQQPPPGPADQLVAFEVQTIDPQSWVVTARDLDSGEEFRFRLPAEAFRGQRFQADLSGAGAGQRVSVQGQREARLRQVRVEMPLGKVRQSEGAFEGRRPTDRGPSRYGVPGAPGSEGDRGTGPDRFALPDGSGRYGNRPGPLAGRGDGSGGPGLYEVVSVDARTWTVTARGEDGGTVSLEVDPRAFEGYRFQASVRGLRAGEGFELLASNERPLSDCCTVKAPPRR